MTGVMSPEKVDAAFKALDEARRQSQEEAWRAEQAERDRKARARRGKRETGYDYLLGDNTEYPVRGRLILSPEEVRRALERAGERVDPFDILY